MSINVYWACVEDEWMRAKSPEKVNKRFYERGIKDKDFFNSAAINYCPAFNTELKNLYAIKSIYDYSFTVNNDGFCRSEMYDQEFFNNHIIIRSIDNKFFSFLNKYIFFTDEESLNMTAYEYPVFEENEITKRCMMVSGKYDIGKWFRPLEFPFILKKEFDTFTVNNEDVLYYLRFHTDKNINLKQFIMTDNLEKFWMNQRRMSFYKTKPFRELSNFYDLFKNKKQILKEIKANLV